MRILYNLLLLLFLFCSCSEVRFSEPQPSNGKELSYIPKQFVGDYLNDEGDTLLVRKDYFHYHDDEIKYLSSDRIFFKKKGKNYFLSCKEILLADEYSDREGWAVFPLKMVEDSLIVSFLNTTQPDIEAVTIEALESMLSVEKYFTKEDKVEYYLIDPTAKQFEEIYSKDVFSVAMKFVRID